MRGFQHGGRSYRAVLKVRSVETARLPASPARVIHCEAVNDDVAGPFEVDAVRGFAVATFDDGSRVGFEGDRLSRGPALGEVPAQQEPRVRPGPDDDGIAGINQARGPLDRPEGGCLRARSRIALLPAETCARATDNSSDAETAEVIAATRTSNASEWIVRSMLLVTSQAPFRYGPATFPASGSSASS